jgi:hypothetical protein
MADTTAIFESMVTHFRLNEAGRPDASLIDVHIVAPVWGASGYYPESVLREACRKRVYPEGMHMHLDHPAREAASGQPARTIAGDSPLAAIFTKDGHYESSGWDTTPENPAGAGVYTVARVLPKFVSDIRAMAGSIGISHYVEGTASEGTAPDGRKGLIIRELRASPLNTVDFVTVPGAAGHYRTLFSEMKVRADPTGDEKTEQRKKMVKGTQETQALSAIRTAHPEVVAELEQRLAEELRIESATTISALEQENKTLKGQIARMTARDYVVAEVAKAHLPAASGRALTGDLVTRFTPAEDGTPDLEQFAMIVKEAIAARTKEIAEILREAGTGLHDNGGGAPAPDGGHAALVDSFEASYLGMGQAKEEAHRLAEIAAGGR